MLSRHGQRGTAMLEFATAATAIFVGMMGIIDFGRTLFTYDLVAHAAQIGTRYASVRGSSCNTSGCTATSTSIATYVKGQVPGVDSTKLGVTTAWSSGNGCTASPYQGPGCVVSVSVSYPFTLMTYPFSQLTISSRSQFIISQ